MVSIVDQGAGRGGPAPAGGFTLPEYLVCLGIAAFVIATVAVGYIVASQRTAFLTASAAAQRLVEARLEEARTVPYDMSIAGDPAQALVNLAAAETVTLQLPRASAEDVIPAILRTTVTTNISSQSPTLVEVLVSCEWGLARGSVVYGFTNTARTYLAPR